MLFRALALFLLFLIIVVLLLLKLALLSLYPLAWSLQDTVTVVGARPSEDGIIETFDNDDEALDAVNNGVVVCDLFISNLNILAFSVFCYQIHLRFSDGEILG